MSSSVEGAPNFGPGAPEMALKGPKLLEYDRTLTSSTLLVQNRWNGMEQVTIYLGWGFDPVGGVGVSPVPNFDLRAAKKDQYCPKMDKMAEQEQKCPKNG